MHCVFSAIFFSSVSSTNLEHIFHSSWYFCVRILYVTFYFTTLHYGYWSVMSFLFLKTWYNFHYRPWTVWITGNSLVPFNFRYSWYHPTLSNFPVFFLLLLSTHFSELSSHSLLILRMFIWFVLHLRFHNCCLHLLYCEFYRLFHEISLAFYFYFSFPLPIVFFNCAHFFLPHYYH